MLDTCLIYVFFSYAPSSLYMFKWLSITREMVFFVVSCSYGKGKFYDSSKLIVVSHTACDLNVVYPGTRLDIVGAQLVNHLKTLFSWGNLLVYFKILIFNKLIQNNNLNSLNLNKSQTKFQLLSVFIIMNNNITKY